MINELNELLNAVSAFLPQSSSSTSMTVVSNVPSSSNAPSVSALPSSSLPETGTLPICEQLRPPHLGDGEPIVIVPPGVSLKDYSRWVANRMISGQEARAATSTSSGSLQYLLGEPRNESAGEVNSIFSPAPSLQVAPPSLPPTNETNLERDLTQIYSKLVMSYGHRGKFPSYEFLMTKAQSILTLRQKILIKMEELDSRGGWLESGAPFITNKYGAKFFNPSTLSAVHRSLEREGTNSPYFQTFLGNREKHGPLINFAHFSERN